MKIYKRDPQQTLRCPSAIFTSRKEAVPDASVTFLLKEPLNVEPVLNWKHDLTISL